MQKPLNLDDFDDFDTLDDLAGSVPIKNVKREQRRTAEKAAAKRGAAPVVGEDAPRQFSYQASRYEAQWINDSLGGFYEQHWFEDVLRLVKGGKEASVYLCKANPAYRERYIAAKVYRPRRFRNLKNDQLYREGRDRLDSDGNVITDDGMQHAMNKRTRFGLELMHTSWIEHEVKTLGLLHAAGADVPEPLTSGNNAILMSYIGDLDGPAPALNEIELDAAEARELYQRVLYNIELMLSLNRIHGDLSAYNILYWEGKITLIDFPQAVSPLENHNAYPIFQRDVQRVCEYFSLQGVQSDPAQLAERMWQAHHYRTAPLVDPLYLDEENPADRQYWERVSRED